ncbi:MAG TPA: siderophore-interacting protein [Acidimicrobiales bacterium]|nr:siderophore-interacting protein [Acidimicrobiales bacterium]
MSGGGGGRLGDSTFPSRLSGASLFDLEVVEAFALTPSMRRIRFGAPSLAGFEHVPGQDLMFSVPADGDRTFRRRYTIRQFDPDALLLDVDVVLHGDGPGATWASGVRPGARIEAIGPRGKILLDTEAQWHLFTAEESAIPATFAMVEALGAGSKAIVLLEVDGRADEQALRVQPGCDLHLAWLYRSGVDPGRSDVLVNAIDELKLPDGRGHAYLNGELKVVDNLRKALLARGLPAEHLSVKPYWRLGIANAAHGEPARD